MRYVVMVAMVMMGAGCVAPVEPEELARKIKRGLPSGWDVRVWNKTHGDDTRGWRTDTIIDADYTTTTKTYAFRSWPGREDRKLRISISHKGVKIRPEDEEYMSLIGFLVSHEGKIEHTLKYFQLTYAEQGLLESLAIQLQAAVKAAS